jgi:hypothetical protein
MGAMADEFVQFFKTSFIEEQADPLARGELAFAVLPGLPLDPSACFGACMTPAELF